MPGLFMKKNSVLTILTIIVILGNLYAYEKNTDPGQANKMNEGEKLFKSNCIVCHKCEKEFVGPMLKGTKSRWENKKAMYKFVRQPSVVIDVDKEPYAVKLYKKYKLKHISFPSLTDKKIDAILDYCGN